MLTRRGFLTLFPAAGALAGVPALAQQRGAEPAAGPLPPSVAALTSMRGGATPISVSERKQRIDRARALMAEQRIDAILLAGGTSLNYFTGVRWGNSERLFAVVVPAKGEPYCVCPAFEEDRAKEQLAAGPLASTEIRTWQEDESPFERVAQGLKDRASPRGASGSRRP